MQVKLKRRSTKLQQEIQARLSKVETIKRSAEPGGENPNEAWEQRKETIQQVEEEISELQRRNAELEQISQTKDNLLFLQVHQLVNQCFPLIRIYSVKHSPTIRDPLVTCLSCLYRDFSTLMNDWMTCCRER